MGLFFRAEDKGKYLFVSGKKFALSLSFIPAICYFIIFPLVYFIFRTNIVLIAIGVLFFLLWFFGMWFVFEGIYYGNLLPKKYKKQGKKIERRIGKGIKIYK
jgi:O-antigen/teichoic acid export membrane protein